MKILGFYRFLLKIRVFRDLSLNGDKTRTNKLLSDTNFDLEKSIFYLSSINHRLNKLNQVNKIKNAEKNLEKSLKGKC